jgi:hypothetical protein
MHRSADRENLGIELGKLACWNALGVQPCQTTTVGSGYGNVQTSRAKERNVRGMFNCHVALPGATPWIDATLFA